MRGQRTAVGLARTIGTGAAILCFNSSFDFGLGRLDILKAKLKLIGIELLGSGAESMPHEGIDDRLEPLDLGIGSALGKSDYGGCGTLSASNRDCSRANARSAAMSSGRSAAMSMDAVLSARAEARQMAFAKCRPFVDRRRRMDPA
jgi:hypothetical protein